MFFFGVAIGLAARMAAQWQPFPIQFAASVTGETVTVCIDGSKVETTFAGKLGFRDQGNVRNLSVCANVRGPIAVGQSFWVKPLQTHRLGGNYSLAGNIVAKYFAKAQTPAQCAGLQIAVWEAIEDGGPYPNFGEGRFMVNASPAAMAWAGQYYQAVGEEGNAILLMTGNGNGQSQMMGVPIKDYIEDPK